MNYKMMARFCALILALEAALMVPPTVISFADGQAKTGWAFVMSLGGMILIAGILFLLSRGASKDFFAKEGLFSVGLGWVLMSLFGCLPFVISGEIPSFIDALFETVSGFSTTGSSVVAAPETLSRGILYWRSFTHWLGGMGVLVFLLALVPTNGKNDGFTMHLLRAESPGPDVGKLVPKMRQTAATLYVVYIALTLLDFLFLLCGKMPAFEAVCTAFGTAGTGGFGVKSDSLASYSPYLQNVTTVFMLLFGVNFSCYYLILIGRAKAVFKDEELRTYFGIILVSVAAITVNIASRYASIWDALRHSSFQVASIITTTGYATADFDAWPMFSKAILVILMALGACAGSTGGGLKLSRALLLIKGVIRNIAQIVHPKKIGVVRMNGNPVNEKVLTNTNSYFAAYMLVLMVSFLLLSFNGLSPTATFTAVLSCFNNIGPGLEELGPTCNFAGLTVFSKAVLILDMLAGRLEIFPILILFNFREWKRG